MRLFSFIFVAAVALTLSACGGKKLSEGGYQYTHHTKKGGKMPQIGDACEVNIVLKSGEKVIRSTIQDGQPLTVVIDSMMKGVPVSPIMAGLKLMGLGDSLTIFYPIDTLKNKPPDLVDVKMLTYDIVLVKIIGKEDYQKQIEAKQQEMLIKAESGKVRETAVATATSQIAADYKANKLKSKIKTTPSGLKYLIVEEGTGEMAEKGKNVTVEYYGCLLDGKKFDASFSRGEPISFPLGQGAVIKGWDEGIALLKEGSKAYFFIPSALAYGEAGSPPSIPANSDLIFYVELVKAN